MDTCAGTEDTLQETKNFIEETGSITDFAQSVMKGLLGDTPIPDGLNDMLSGVFGSLQANVDRLVTDGPADNTSINDAFNNLQAIVNGCFQDEYIGTTMQDIARWFGDVKLQNHDSIFPLLLTWLIHGRAFEKIVSTLNDQATQVSWPINTTILDAAVVAIETSIENGYRTGQQWCDYFDLYPDINGYIVKKFKNQILDTNVSSPSECKPKGRPGREKGLDGSLSQFLTCRNSHSVLTLLESFIKDHPSANDIALTGIVLRNLNLIPDLTEDRETSSAIYKEFSSKISDMRAESSIRRSMGLLSRTFVKTETDGSKREIFEYDVEPYATRKQILSDQIQKAIEA